MPPFPGVPKEVIFPAVIEFKALTVMFPPVFPAVFKSLAFTFPVGLESSIVPPFSPFEAVTFPNKLIFPALFTCKLCALIFEFAVTSAALAIRFPSGVVAPTDPLKVMLPLPAARFRFRVASILSIAPPKPIFPPAVFNTASFVNPIAPLILMLPLFVVTLPPNLVFKAVTFKPVSGVVFPIFPCSSTLPALALMFKRRDPSIAPATLTLPPALLRATSLPSLTLLPLRAILLLSFPVILALSAIVPVPV